MSQKYFSSETTTLRWQKYIFKVLPEKNMSVFRKEDKAARFITADLPKEVIWAKGKLSYWEKPAF